MSEFTLPVKAQNRLGRAFKKDPPATVIKTCPQGNPKNSSAGTLRGQNI
jgi:hypothetical protein